MDGQGREGKENQRKKHEDKTPKKYDLDRSRWINRVGSCEILFQESKMLNAISGVLQSMTMPAALLNIHLE